MSDYIFEFGTHLKKLREDSNMSQATLAKLIGMSASSISKFENGTQEPDYNKLKKLANVFKISVDYLIGYSSNDTIVIDSLPDETKTLVREVVASITKYEEAKK